eukprot:g5758.t1
MQINEIMPRRKSVSCPICYKKFFQASFPFHIKVCAKQNSGSFETLICPLCNIGVRGHLIAGHVKICKHSSGVSVVISKSIANEYESMGLPFDNIQNNMEVATEFNDQLTLKPCNYCKRKFNTQRILAHEKICKKMFITPKRGIFNSSLKRQISFETLGFIRGSKESSTSILPSQKEQSRVRNTTVNRSRIFSSSKNSHKNIRKINNRNKTGNFRSDHNPFNSSNTNNNDKHSMLKVNIASQSNPLAPDHSRYDNVGHYH